MQAFHVLWTKGINVQMISQGASKVIIIHCLSQNSLLSTRLTKISFLQVNISLIVNDDEAEGCVEALHKSFFESGDLSELLIQPRLGNGSPVRTMQVDN